MAYEAMIHKCGVKTDAPLIAIESLMRVNNGGVLCHLDAERFAAEARLAVEVWSLLDANDRRFYSEAP